MGVTLRYGAPKYLGFPFNVYLVRFLLFFHVYVCYRYFLVCAV